MTTGTVPDVESSLMDHVTHRSIMTNGIAMHVAEQGEGPAVVLCHGFPELWYSWRHQIGALADAGFHVVAPDQRGYGATDRPAAIEDYDILHLTDDLLGLLDALGEEKAVFVGHDWGAPVVWNLAQRAPDRVRAVVGLSVPFLPRGDTDPISLFETLFADTFFYMLYFQEPGVADADLGARPTRHLRRFMSAISAEGAAEAFRLLLEQGTRFADWLADPGVLPGWLTRGRSRLLRRRVRSHRVHRRTQLVSQHAAQLGTDRRPRPYQGGRPPPCSSPASRTRWR